MRLNNRVRGTQKPSNRAVQYSSSTSHSHIFQNPPSPSFTFTVSSASQLSAPTSNSPYTAANPSQQNHHTASARSKLTHWTPFLGNGCPHRRPIRPLCMCESRKEGLGLSCSILWRHIMSPESGGDSACRVLTWRFCTRALIRY